MNNRPSFFQCMGETVGYLNAVFIAEVDHHVAAKDHVETWLELVGIRQQIEGLKVTLSLSSGAMRTNACVLSLLRNR